MTDTVFIKHDQMPLHLFHTFGSPPGLPADTHSAVCIPTGRLARQPQQQNVCPASLRGPNNLLFNEYHGLFTSASCGLGTKLMTPLHLVPRLRTNGAIPPYHICLHGAHRVSVTFTLLYTVMGISSHNSRENTMLKTEEN